MLEGLSRCPGVLVCGLARSSVGLRCLLFQLCVYSHCLPCGTRLVGVLSARSAVHVSVPQQHRCLLCHARCPSLSNDVSAKRAALTFWYATTERNRTRLGAAPTPRKAAAKLRAEQRDVPPQIWVSVSALRPVLCGCTLVGPAAHMHGAHEWHDHRLQRSSPR